MLMLMMVRDLNSIRRHGVAAGERASPHISCCVPAQAKVSCDRAHGRGKQPSHAPHAQHGVCRRERCGYIILPGPCEIISVQSGGTLPHASQARYGDIETTT